MRKYTKNIIYFIFYCLRNILNIFFNFKEISVFCYHSISDRDWDIAISPKIFEQQIIFLKKQNYYFANLNEIIGYIKGEKDLPQKQ